LEIRPADRQTGNGHRLHRKGFRLFWSWKIGHGQRGRPAVPQEIRDLIRRLSRNNPLWGAPRIHGELLKLGVEITEPTVAKYMLRRSQPPSQTWRTFLENHVKSMVSVDFFAVPTLRFQVLYVFLLLAHHRRRIVQFGVTGSSHSRVDGTATAQCLSLGQCAALSAAGPRSDLGERLC
jgi:hypothetical protein